MSWCENKVVLVTGSSSGIGKGIALHFARLGARVVVTGRNEDRVKAVAEECDAASPNGNKALPVVADFESRETLKHLIERVITKFGRIDVLVNNAGTSKIVNGISDPNMMEAYDQIMATNVAAIIYLSQLAARHLIDAQGVIINVSSVAAKRPHPMFLPYCVSKAAVDMVTQCLALDLGPKGVRVNGINPAAVETPIFERMGMPVDSLPSIMDHYREQSPIGRIGTVEDCAHLVEFLASPRASWITGTNVTLDGGFSLYRQSPKVKQ